MFSKKQAICWLAGLALVGCLAGCASTSSSSSKSVSSTTTTGSGSSGTAAAAATTVPATTTTTKPKPKPAVRHVTGKLTTLGAGNFIGGKDVPVGLYDVTTTPGQSGNFIVMGKDDYDEILGSGGDGLPSIPKIRVQISSGDKIQISELSKVTFTPVTAPFKTAHKLTTLYAGTFVVGQDIGAGSYVATPGAGQSGNFIISGSDEVDEILGKSDGEGVPSVTTTLSKGDVIDISGLNTVTMTPTS